MPLIQKTNWNRRRRLAWSWFASFFFHFLLLFLITSNFFHHPSKEAKIKSESFVEVVFTETPESKTKSQSKNSDRFSKSPLKQSKLRKGGTKSAHLQNSLKITDLLPGPLTALNSKNISGVSKAETDSDPGTIESPFFNGGENMGMYNYIYRTMESHVIYPEELRTKHIQGQVTADVVFSADGEYLRSASSVHAEDNYLRVLVWKILRETFKEKLNSNFIKRNKKIEIRCVFHFEVTENDNQFIEAEKNFVAGNNLVFYRHYQDSKLSWNLGPLHGWILPSSVDLIWFYDKADKALSKKERTDPLNAYRNDPEW